MQDLPGNWWSQNSISVYLPAQDIQGHSITNHELELSFERLEQYLNTTTNVIKEGILAQFNKDETETIISNQTPLDIETIQEFQDNFIVPMIW